MVNTIDVKALRERAMQSDDIVYDTVQVDEWGGEYPVRSLPGGALKKVMAQSRVGKGGERDEMRLIMLAAIYGCADKDGNRVFDDKDLAVFESDKKSAAPLIKIGAKVLELSNTGEKGLADAKN